ncbi:MAG: hypothetical protein ACRD0P_06220 [Stackebrandtia sp.]
MSNPPHGLGRPPEGAPDIWAPVEPRPDAGYAPPKPPEFVEALPLEPPPNNRNAWALLGGLAVVAVIGLVTALFVIGDDQPDTPSPQAAASSDVSIECEPSEPGSGERLSAEQFYEDKVWTNSLDDKVTADRTGRWDYKDCCDVGLGKAQADLNELGCSYGIESAFESSDGHLGIAQLILAFGDTGSAMAASEMDFTSFRLHEESGVYDEKMEVYGYVEPSGDFLILTIGSIDTDDSDIVNDAQQVLEAFHVDYASTLPY